MLDHRGHDFTDLHEKAQLCRAEVNQSMACLNATIATISRNISKMNAMETRLESNRELVKLQISDGVDDLMETIMDQQRHLLRDLDDRVNGKLEELITKREAMQKKHEDLRAVRMSSTPSFDGERDEQFIFEALKLSKQTFAAANYQPDFDVDAQVKFHFTITNNGQLGIIEDGLESEVREKEEIPKPVPEKGAPKYMRAKIIGRFKTSSFFSNPSGIVVLANGKIAVADSKIHGLFTCDRSGAGQARIHIQEAKYPMAAVVGREGQLAITSDKWIKVFAPNGVKISQFTTDKSLRAPSPCSLAIDDEQNFVVSDVRNCQVYVMDPSGRILDQFNSEDENQQVPDPFNIALHHNRIWLSYPTPDGAAGVIRMFNPSGKQLHIGKLPGTCEGLCCDVYGSVIAASGAGGLFLFSAEGHLMHQIETVDKSNKPFKLWPRSVSLLPDSTLAVINVNPSLNAAKKSELILLDLLTH